MLKETIPQQNPIEKEKSKEDREKLSIQQMQENFNKAYEQFDNFVGFMGLKIDMHTPLAEQELKLSDKEKERLKQLALNVAQAAALNDNIFESFNFFRWLSMEEKIKERAKQSIRHRNGQIHLDLVLAVAEYGTEEEALDSYRQLFSQMGLMGVDAYPVIKEKFKNIEARFNEFLEKNSYEFLASFTPEFLNAALELREKNYDLAIGVLNGGGPMAMFLEFLGTQAKYIEWHRDWKKGPVQRKIGPNKSPISKGKKILICENDTQTGATLKAIIPFLKKLKPEQIDVSFLVDLHGTNHLIVENSLFYKNAFNLGEFSPANFVDNLIKLEKELKKTEKQEEK